MLKTPFTRRENPSWLPQLFGLWTSFLFWLADNFRMKLPKNWATAQGFWSGCKESAEYHLISQYYGVWIWDIKHFSDQEAEGYVWFWQMKISFQSGSLSQGMKGFSAPLQSPLAGSHIWCPIMFPVTYLILVTSVLIDASSACQCFANHIQNVLCEGGQGAGKWYIITKMLMICHGHRPRVMS